MPHFHRWSAVLFASALLAGVAAPAARAGEADHPLLKKRAPDIQPDFTTKGNMASLAQLRGRVVLLEFWAVWCGPCRQVSPRMSQLQKAYGSDGLTVIGLTSYYGSYDFDSESGKLRKVDGGAGPLSAAAERDMLKTFARHYEMDYKVMAVPFDRWKEVSAAYGVEYIPMAVLIDRLGVVRKVCVGLDACTDSSLEDAIEQLLEER